MSEQNTPENTKKPKSNKGKLGLGIAGGVFLVLGGALLGVGFAINGGLLNRFDGFNHHSVAGDTEYEPYTFTAEEYADCTDLKITNVWGDIKILTHEDPTKTDIVVDYFADDISKYEFKIEDDTVKIENDWKDNWFWNVWYWPTVSQTVTCYVPQGLDLNIDIFSTNGSVTLVDANYGSLGQKIKATTVNGSLHIANQEFFEYEIHATNGDINLYNLVSTDNDSYLIARSVNGDVNISSLTANAIELHSTNGDVAEKWQHEAEPEAEPALKSKKNATLDDEIATIYGDFKRYYRNHFPKDLTYEFGDSRGIVAAEIDAASVNGNLMLGKLVSDADGEYDFHTVNGQVVIADLISAADAKYHLRSVNGAVKAIADGTAAQYNIYTSSVTGHDYGDREPATADRKLEMRTVNGDVFLNLIH